MRSLQPLFSKEYFFLLLITVPVLFMNVSPEHSYGDDFAAYINQAFAILHHIPQDKTGYIFNPDYPNYAPPSYAVGFPLLLAPIVALFGQDFVPMKVYVGMFIVATAFVVFHFFRRSIGWPSAFVIAIVWTYSPWILDFKANILSDIPFTFFFMWSVLLFNTNKRSSKIAFYAGVLCGFSMCIRPIGIVAPAAAILYAFFLFIRTKQLDKIQAPILFTLSAMSIYVVVNKLLFPVSTEQLSHFGGMISHFSLAVIQTNFEYYYNWQLPQYLTFQGYQHTFLTKFFLYFFLVAIVGGFLYKFIKKPDELELVTGLYILAVFVFPERQGFRYMFPLSPFLFYYLFNFGKWTVMLKYFLPFLVLVAWMVGIVQYTPQGLNDDNICKPESEAMFKFVRDSLPGQEPILFEKARAMVLRTQRKAIPFSNAQTKEQNKKWISSHHCRYAVLFKWDDPSHFDIDSLVYTNGMFDIIVMR